MSDILDAAVEAIVHDDYNHVRASVLRKRLEAIRDTHSEERLMEEADAFIAIVRQWLREPGDPEYGKNR